MSKISFIRITCNQIACNQVNDIIPSAFWKKSGQERKIPRAKRIEEDGSLMKRRLSRPGEIQEVREEGGRVDLAAQQEQQEAKVGPERIRRKWKKKRGRKNGYQAKEKSRGKKRAPIAGFVVDFPVICSFDIIASKLFGGTWIYVWTSWLPISTEIIIII